MNPNLCLYFYFIFQQNWLAIELGWVVHTRKNCVVQNQERQTAVHLQNEDWIMVFVVLVVAVLLLRKLKLTVYRNSKICTLKLIIIRCWYAKSPHKQLMMKVKMGKPEQYGDFFIIAIIFLFIILLFTKVYLDAKGLTCAS